MRQPERHQVFKASHTVRNATTPMSAMRCDHQDVATPLMQSHEVPASMSYPFGLRTTMLKWLTVLLLAVPLCAYALEFRENPATGEITATGVIEPDDADRLTRLLTLEYRQRHRLVRNLVTVSLDSPGGSVLGGLRLGYALRQLGTHTNVPSGRSCLSACAVAFLGGQARTVEGEYGVHATSMSSNAPPIGRAELLDTAQQLGALITAYTLDMTGKADVALRALSTSARDMSILTDAELAAMGVITLARRPSQFGRTGFRCPERNEFGVLYAICSHLDIAELDRELNTLYTQIQSEGAPAGLALEQERWRRYRNSCIHDGQPNGYASVVHCVREAYLIRRDQLKSIWLAIAAKKTQPGSRNWAPIEARR